uniref:Uncharacterized protein LOC100179634 n=1 Tax=Phallusia mammillata TaxID=59560 RepID=A0A6F9DHL0_9ASCI|nr:uncharacterized protein LOC100179634 [Phallusia mammillata]
MLICFFTLVAVLFGQSVSQEVCADQLGAVQCRLMSLQDACRIRRTEMLLSCAKTCDLCATGRSLPCSDISAASCSSYVVLGLCEQFKDSLENTCRWSCGWYTVGAWGAWGRWTRCSASCGLGSQTRKRTCPSQDCGIAPSQEARQCNVQSCNTDRYSTWTAWSSCPVTCGAGTRVRTRRCLNPSTFSVLFIPCSEVLRQEQRCIHSQACPVYSWLSWSNWGGCTRTCGQGVKTRRRNCNIGVASNCAGVPVENQHCNEFDCPEQLWLSGRHRYATASRSRIKSPKTSPV